MRIHGIPKATNVWMQQIMQFSKLFVLQF